MRAINTLRSSLFAIAMFVVFAHPVRAQVGSTTDIIMGKVTSEDNQPVAGARIEVKSSETGITRRKTTNEKGEYSIIFPDGGGTYEIHVTFIGYGPYSSTVTRQSDEDRLVKDVRLTHAPQVLAAVQVRANNNQQQNERPTAGSTERNLTAAQLDRLPIDKGDLAAVAALAPGVISTSATDSTASTFSVGGQPTNQNQITLDGLSFGSNSVPSEAIRGTRVITNTYDVSRGQFTGGQIASTTRGGTNNLQGVATYALRDPDLEFVDESATTFGQKYQQNTVGFFAGGPILEDEMFISAAGSISRRTNPLSSLLAADPLTLARLGANPTSVGAFLGQLNTIGVHATLPGVPDERLADQASALSRYDWSLGESNTLMIRANWQGQLQDGTRIGSLSVPSTGGNLHTTGGGLMGLLTTHLDNGIINEAKLFKSEDHSTTNPYLIAPDGRVTVASTLDDGTQSIANLQFGGNPSLPTNTRTSLFETTDEISYITSGSAHRLKLGFLFNEDRSTTGAIPNQYGTFYYNSLSDFQNNIPSQFTRTISGQDRFAGSNNEAVYLGDAWRKSPMLQFTYGLRLEGTQFPDHPAFNPLVQQYFGRATDQTPTEVALSPRLGFTVFTGAPATPPAGANGAPGAGAPGGGAPGGGGPGGRGGGPGGFNASAWTFRGGVGEFRGKISSNLVANAVNATGLAGGQAQLSCIGSGVPVPSWSSYLSDPTTIPTECVGGPAGSTTVGQALNVTTFEDGFSAPKVWRSSLGAGRRFFQRYNFNIDGSYAYGINQTGVRDLNLNNAPQFVIGNEGGRPVYSPASTIFGSTGATTISSSRVHSEFGSVSEYTSDLRSTSAQVTVSTGGITMQGITINGSYTFTRARDQQNGFSAGGGGFGGQTTAGDPNLVSWGTSDLERRHAFQGQMSIPVSTWVYITAIGRVVAGQAYTPVVNGDVNGDGSRNDRAFIFNPTTAGLDTGVANGIARLLANAPARTQSCLQSQLGLVAARNSCSTPFTPSLDMQVNLNPDAFGVLQRRLTMSLQLQNTLVGVDQLLHGSNNLHGWGQPVIPDRTLLFVRGFDPATNQFKYSVNGHFGVTDAQNSAFRVPFQIGLQGRLTIGQDPARQAFQRQFGGGGPQTPEAFKARMTRLIPNPFFTVLGLNDSLKLDLTAEQKAKLRTLSDTIAPKADQIAQELADILSNAGTAPDPAVLGVKMQSRTEEARKLGEQTFVDLKKVLTKEQWDKLPDSVKTMPQGNGGGRGPGGF